MDLWRSAGGCLDANPAVRAELKFEEARSANAVQLMTIHSAKGQEWKVVHVLSAVDGCIPASMATGTAEEIEEERRLLYVAMTRAKDDLHVIVPQRFFVRQQANRGDRHTYVGRSRFIPDELTTLFECCMWPVADPTAEELDVAQGHLFTPVDVTAPIRARWA